MTGTEVERVDAPRRHRARELRRRPRARRRAAPGRRPADASAWSTSARATPRRSSAARPTSPPARPSRSPQPGAVMPDGTKLKRGQAPRRRVPRDDPGRGRARDRHRPRRDHGARRRASRPARRWPTCCRSPPTCSSSRSPPTGPTAWASTASRARCTPRPARRCSRRRGASDPGSAGRRRRRRDRRRVPGPVPALHRARVRGREDRPVAARG